MFGTLRTLLAFNVVLLHVFSIPVLGNYSVTFFFVLSGFLMTYIMQNRYGYTLKGFKVFWQNRALRLYPVYYTILLVTIILILVYPNLPTHPSIELPTTLKDWLSNLTMIYPNIVPHRINPRLSPPTWALTNELFFYLLVSLGISKNIKRTLIWLVVSVGYYLFTYLFYDLATFRYSAIPAASLPFALGSLLFWVNKRYTTTFHVAIPILLYVAFLINGVLSNDFGALFKEITIYINMVMATLMVWILFNVKTNKRIKSIDKYLGNYSYPFYLAHYLVVILYVGTIGYGVRNPGFKLDLSALYLYLPMLIVVSFLLVHLVDHNIEKIRNKLKNRLSQIKQIQ